MIAAIDGGSDTTYDPSATPAAKTPPPAPPTQTSTASATDANSPSATPSVASTPDSIQSSSSAPGPNGTSPNSPSLLDAAQTIKPDGTSWLDTNPLNLGSAALKGVSQANPTGWFPQGPLPPNSSLTDPQTGYKYTSDMFGRPKTAEGTLTKNPDPSATRDAAAKDAQRLAGGADRLPTDQGGHGIGNQFFGRNDQWNLTPQDDNLNHSAYRQMENSWSRTLRDNGPGSVTAKVENVYDQPTTRPTDYVSRYSEAGGPERLRVMSNAPNAGATNALGDVGKSEATLNSLGKVSQGLETLGKVATPLAIAGDAVQLYNGFKEDGNTIGTHTLEAGGSVAGGWAGASLGAETGAEVGAGVGAMFGGVGAVPGAIIGGIAGGVIGGVAGSELGKDAVQVGEKAVGAIADAGKSAVHALGSAASSVANFFGF